MTKDDVAAFYESLHEKEVRIVATIQSDDGQISAFSTLDGMENIKAIIPLITLCAQINGTTPKQILQELNRRIRYLERHGVL